MHIVYQLLVPWKDNVVIWITKVELKNHTSKKQCINRYFVILSNLMFNIYLLLIYVGAKITFCVSYPYQNKKIFCELAVFQFVIYYLIPITKLFLFVVLYAIQNGILRYSCIVIHIFSDVYSSYGEQRTSPINIIPIPLDLLFSQ